MRNYDKDGQTWQVADGGYLSRDISDQNVWLEERARAMPSFREIYHASSYLTKEDCGAGLVFNIYHVEVVEFDEGKKLVASDGNGKAFVINVTNSEALARMFGTDDFDQWRGKVELYNDQNVRFGANRGGIRVRPTISSGAGPVATAQHVSAAAQAYLDDLDAVEHTGNTGMLPRLLESVNTDFAADKLTAEELGTIVKRAGQIQSK